MPGNAGTDYAHTEQAQANRHAKAASLYFAACRLGYSRVPTDPKERLGIRKDTELSRDPSAETWALVDGMLAAWPPRRASDPGPACWCTPDPDSDNDVLYEAPPRDYSTHRFPGRLCPHHSPLFWTNDQARITRVPTISDRDRARLAITAAYQAGRHQQEPASATSPSPSPAGGADTRRAGSADDSASTSPPQPAPADAAAPANPPPTRAAQPEWWDY